MKRPPALEPVDVVRSRLLANTAEMLDSYAAVVDDFTAQLDPADRARIQSEWAEFRESIRLQAVASLDRIIAGAPKLSVIAGGQPEK